MNSKNDMKEKILERIRAEGVSMRPKVFFSLHVAATVIVMLAVLVVSVFLFSFLLFSIRAGGHHALLGFGPRGFFAFLHIFPWHWLLVDIGLILLLESLLRRFRFGYRTPILHLLVLLIAAVLASGFLLDKTTFNDRLAERAPRLPPPFGTLYEGARRPPPPGSGVCRCTITAIEDGTLTVEDTRGGETTTLTVELPADDPRATTSALVVGDTVVIAGERDDEAGVIRAYGVRKIDPNKKRGKWFRHPPRP